MDSLQLQALQRLFEAQRLDPSVPEHALFIEGELAKLKVMEPDKAKSHKAFYDKKLADYLALQKAAGQADQSVGEEPKGELTVADLQEVLDKKAAKVQEEVKEKDVPKKKPGRKPKQ